MSAADDQQSRGGRPFCFIVPRVVCDKFSSTNTVILEIDSKKLVDTLLTMQGETTAMIEMKLKPFSATKYLSCLENDDNDDQDMFHLIKTIADGDEAFHKALQECKDKQEHLKNCKNGSEELGIAAKCYIDSLTLFKKEFERLKNVYVKDLEKWTVDDFVVIMGLPDEDETNAATAPNATARRADVSFSLFVALFLFATIHGKLTILFYSIVDHPLSVYKWRRQNTCHVSPFAVVNIGFGVEPAG